MSREGVLDRVLAVAFPGSVERTRSSGWDRAIDGLGENIEAAGGFSIVGPVSKFGKDWTIRWNRDHQMMAGPHAGLLLWIAAHQASRRRAKGASPVIDVQSKVKVYELNGDETPMLDTPAIEVHSHWNRREFVVLHVGRRKYTVAATDLTEAIQNATRTGSR